MFHKPYRTYPLRTTLVIAVMATAITVIAIILLGSGIPSYNKAKKEFRLLWESMAKQVSENATEQILRFFQNAPITLGIVEGLVVEEQLKVANSESLFDICYRVLKENPQFSAVYYIDANKTFYGVFRVNGIYTASLRKQTEGGKTAIQNYSIGPKREWIASSEEIGEYDPEKRPFWKTATARPEGGWSDPYRFATTGAQGYSYVLGQNGPQGVIGYWVIDFEIDQLSRFLKTVHLGQQGVVSLISNEGTVIAESAKQIPYARWKPKDEKEGFFVSGPRVFYVNPFPKNSGILWKVVTSIHKNDFLGPVRAEAFRSLLYGLVPCLFFLILTASFFGRVSRRLKEIAWEMDELGNLTFKDHPHKLHLSKIREINVMNHSLGKMKVGLQSFARYIPVGLVKKLIFSGHEAEAGAEKKEITVLFADLVSFTAMAEKLTPDEVSQIIEEFFTTVSHEVHKENGIIDKFMGDAVMALWGTPEPLENSALAACRSALAIQKALASNPKMKHRIGINTGLAMVGNFGSNERLNYTAIGDTVNIAARLEKFNKQTGTQILIGPDTAAAVEKFMHLRPLQSALLEGRNTPILIYELLGEKN